ncbi:MAG: hypothetical protein J0G37_00415 [Afipia sp.]|nr:hypothetical protein [Afipia sp.]
MRGPEPLVAAEPFHGLFHRRRIQPARHRASGLGPDDQPGVAEHIEVFHDGGQRHRERLRQFADGDGFAALKFRQQGTPRRIGNGGKNPVQAIG